MPKIPDFLRKSEVEKVVPSELPARRAGNTSPEHLAKMTEEGKKPVSVLAGAQPKSYEDARELMRRAVAEVAMKPQSLRRLYTLLRQENPREARGTWEAVFEFIRGEKQDGGGGKPTQISISNYVARPKDSIAAIDVTKLEAK